MRKFSSYGSIDKDLHYYVPRQELIDYAYLQLLGENPDKGGHYITVWAPRQRGKTSVMQQVIGKLKENDYFEVAILTMQGAREETNTEGVLDVLLTELRGWFSRDFPDISTWKGLNHLFAPPHFSKPLILILDEFDNLDETFINKFANQFRTMYTRRSNELDKKSAEKSNLLHGLALIGVRSVLGIESVTGSPFNIQHSLHIPNLTFAEVDSMFHWYERESDQQVEQAVIDRVFYETNGQPGLVGWLGELLTETFNKHNPAIVRRDFEIAYAAAVDVLPNSNIINIISKAKQEPYKQLVLELFQTDTKLRFKYEKPDINFLYMNGVVDQEVVDETERYLKFPCPFIQKKLFNYFAGELFHYVGQLYDPLDDLDDVFTPQGLHLQSLLKRYEHYLQQNRAWLFKNAPRRHDLRLYEAVYHFNFYMYLAQFLQRREGTVWPEFPAGNGKVDLMVKYKGQIYGLEIKSFADNYEYKKSLKQAADYAHQLQLTEITLVLFIETVDDKNRARYEVIYDDPQREIKVVPVFVVTSA